MKKRKHFIVALILIFATTTIQAQFFKNLQKKAEEKIAREAERRAERRVNKKIDDAFDKTEETIDGATKPKKKRKSKSASTKTKATIKDTYSFEWEQTLQMETKDGKINMIYFLTNNASYIGVKMILENAPMKDMFTVMDQENGAMITLMNIDGKKMKRIINVSNDEDDVDNTQFTITETDTKTILGYHCQGYKIVSEDGIINTYVATNAPVSGKFTTGAKSPKGFNANAFKKIKKGLLMEMDFKSSKKKKYNLKMTCTSLKQKQIIINTKEYGSFGF